MKQLFSSCQNLCSSPLSEECLTLLVFGSMSLVIALKTCLLVSFISYYSTYELDSMEADKLLMENEDVVVKTEYFQFDENLSVSNP